MWRLLYISSNIQSPNPINLTPISYIFGEYKYYNKQTLIFNVNSLFNTIFICSKPFFIILQYYFILKGSKEEHNYLVFHHKNIHSSNIIPNLNMESVQKKVSDSSIFTLHYVFQEYYCRILLYLTCINIVFNMPKPASQLQIETREKVLVQIGNNMYRETKRCVIFKVQYG
jgi:hypothetical protein